MGERVLIVEDEAIIAEDIRRTLGHLGYDVPRTAATGADAVALAEALRPRLILMDIKLKGAMDGIEAAAMIRERFGIPVVYLTSHSDEATLARAKETQPYGYILKPFEDRELRIAIEVALRKHELESRLAERERWFATTLESIGDAVMAIDPRDVITFLNPVAEKVTGWGRAEAVGKKLMDVLRLVDDEGALLDLSRAPREKFAAAVPTHAGLVPRSGANIPVDNTAAPIVDAKGNVLGQVVVFRDITERRNLEHRLATSERMAAIGTMAAGMGHEINNPLAYVIANVAVGVEATDELERGLKRVTASRVPDAELDALLKTVIDLRAALRDAHEGAERVRKIVEDLKKFTRAEDQQLSVLDLPDVLDAAIKMTANHVRHHAQLRKEYGTTPFVEASEGPLVQLFTNLLVNAAQAIVEGNADTERIRVVTYSDDAGRAVVEIHDTGSGIAKENLRRLFDPFFTTKPVGAGMGLGLSISHAVVVGLGGEITVESEPGRGAMFRVTLPAAVAKRGVARADDPQAASVPQRRGRVLIVDDDASVGKSVARVLRSAHDCIVETDARAALARLTAGETFDLIFCDLMMPSMTGMDLYDAVVALSPDVAQRIVFLTGGAFSPRATQFIESVANLTTDKPFSPERLRAIAKDYVR
jgi:two-component system cell cycle sensor histidine kinase/response regulator CckA